MRSIGKRKPTAISARNPSNKNSTRRPTPLRKRIELQVKENLELYPDISARHNTADPTARTHQATTTANRPNVGPGEQAR